MNASTVQLQNLVDRIELLERHVATLLSREIKAPVSVLTHPTVADIIAAVAKDHGLTRLQLAGRSRQLSVTRARFLAIYLIHRCTDLSRAEIMRHFSERGHEMVGYAMSAVEARRDTDPAFARRLAAYLERFAIPET